MCNFKKLIIFLDVQRRGLLVIVLVHRRHSRGVVRLFVFVFFFTIFFVLEAANAVVLGKVHSTHLIFILLFFVFFLRLLPSSQTPFLTVGVLQKGKYMHKSN